MATIILTPDMDIQTALGHVASGEVDIACYQEWDAARIKLIERKAQLAASAAPRSLSCKVSEKGAVSVYGLNARFPMTLYADQWTRLFGFREQLEAFIVANKGKLSVK